MLVDLIRLRFYISCCAYYVATYFIIASAAQQMTVVIVTLLFLRACITTHIESSYSISNDTVEGGVPLLLHSCHSSCPFL